MRDVHWIVMPALVLGLGLLGMGACTPREADLMSACLDPAAHNSLGNAIRDQVEANMANLLQNDGVPLASRSNIRASVAQVGLSIDLVMTTKKDPASSKRFCSGTLKATLPADVIAGAEATYALLKTDALSTYAEKNRVERAANVFSTPVEFSVQPTDDGQTIYSELETDGGAIGFLTEVLVAHLARNEVQRRSDEAERARQEQERLSQDAAKAENDAALAAAKGEHALANQMLAAAWSGLPEPSKAALADSQSMWDKKMRAACNLEAAQSSNQATLRDTSLFRCAARMTRERAGEVTRLAWNG